MYLFLFRGADSKHFSLLCKNKNIMMEQKNIAGLRQAKKVDRNYDLTLSINGSPEVDAVVRVTKDATNRKEIRIDQYTHAILTITLSEIEEYLEPAVDVLVLAFRGAYFQLRFPSQVAKAQFMEAISAHGDSGISSGSSSSNSSE